MWRRQWQHCSALLGRQPSHPAPSGSPQRSLWTGLTVGPSVKLMCGPLFKNEQVCDNSALKECRDLLVAQTTHPWSQPSLWRLWWDGPFYGLGRVFSFGTDPRALYVHKHLSPVPLDALAPTCLERKHLQLSGAGRLKHTEYFTNCRSFGDRAACNRVLLFSKPWHLLTARQSVLPVPIQFCIIFGTDF